IISGNAVSGVDVFRDDSTGNVVQGNYIGTDVTGTRALGNQGHGIDLGAPNNTIGGPAPRAGNLISGNKVNGIDMTASIFTGPPLDSGPGVPAGNLIQGNSIGTDVTGTVALGNGGAGINLANGGA